MDLRDSVRLKRRSGVGLAVAMTACLLLGAGFAGQGCSARDPDALSPRLQSGLEMMRNRNARRGHVPVSFARLRVTIVEIPAGLSKDALWKEVDESVVAGAVRHTLNNNGFRVGLGRADQWDTIRSILGRLSGRAVETSVVVNAPDCPLVVNLKDRQGEALAFAVHSDQTVSGRNLPPGDYVVSFLCSYDPMNPSDIRVTGQPQVHGSQRVPKAVGTGLDVSLVNHRQIVGVDLLTFQAAVPKGGLLVMGSSAAMERAHSLGGLFLAATREGMPVERLVVLIPEIVQDEGS